MDNKKKIFVSAGEYSGSMYVSGVLKSVKQNYPDLILEGIGGTELKKIGVNTIYNSDDWGSIGIVEALKRWKLIWINLKVQKYLEESKPDLIILVDYPGFNMHLARKAKKLGIPSIYVFPPRKFCVDASRLTDAVNNIKRVAAEFQPTFDCYKEAGACVDFVGHPMLDLLPVGDPQALRQDLGFQKKDFIILLMPGSRAQEINLLLPLYEETVQKIYQNKKNLKFVLLGANNFESQENMKSELESIHSNLKKYGVDINLSWENRFNLMQVADLALVTSGTATMELTVYGVPMVICYKVSKLTEVLAVFFNKLPKYIGLPNLLANEMIISEFIQEEANSENLSKEILKLVDDDKKRAQLKKQLLEVKEKMGSKGALARIETMIVEELGLKS
ncbi:MAG: lipid-A-disaccharide synthase [Candidatus Cloacimonadota bacterium]|nr:MAG: lipid-A-disaccharide synthase [Candidatus Cloacimonadota bacterium]